MKTDRSNNNMYNNNNTDNHNNFNRLNWGASGRGGGRQHKSPVIKNCVLCQKGFLNLGKCITGLVVGLPPMC